jgi:hypothetical protein
MSRPALPGARASPGNDGIKFRTYPGCRVKFASRSVTGKQMSSTRRSEQPFRQAFNPSNRSPCLQNASRPTATVRPSGQEMSYPSTGMWPCVPSRTFGKTFVNPWYNLQLGQRIRASNQARDGGNAGEQVPSEDMFETRGRKHGQSF